MKTKNLFLLPALISGLGLLPAGRVTAQTFTTLHNFAGYPSDGAFPVAGLILSGNTLYGTAKGGGSSGSGTVFAVRTDGTGFTNLYSFTALTSVFENNSDGAYPATGLILSGNTLYGTADRGGNLGYGTGYGTVFAVQTDGTGFTNLHSFTYGGSDGASPAAGLILSSNILYGTRLYDLSSGYGTVFALNTDGTGFTNLHTFIGSDGTYPDAVLILSGTTLYGTASGGGSSDAGTAFAVHTDGTGFTNLYNFTAAFYSYPYTNSDGANPLAGLILSGNTLYGTASHGGSSGNGTVFAVHTDGTGFTNLHSFTLGGSDGANPQAGLILSGNTLYGTMSHGGSSGNGTLFAVHTDGTGFTNLYNFTAPAYDGYGYYTNSDGANPQAGLILSSNILYGTALNGGSSGSGTVFSLSLPPPPLTIIRSGANVILTWPTNAVGFTLQSTTNLVSPAVWSTNSSAPVVIGGQNVITNPISGAQQLFRLISK